MNIQRLPDAELLIMKIVWRYGGEVTSAQIISALDGRKGWAQATVLNFMARLVSRGFLSVRRDGKINIYTPIVNEDVYLEIESKLFLERLHGNSLKSFVAALYSGDAIDQSDLDELKRFIEEADIQ